jgi:TfoX/Sxy family transcriptional regulator of competence genes
MAINQDLEARVRAALAGAGTVREVKMFGGLGFMLSGNLVVAVSSRGLLARVGKERQSEALARPGARPMVMRGRTMEGYIHVEPAALNPRALKEWVHLATQFVGTLPAKPTAKPRQARSKGKS